MSLDVVDLPLLDGKNMKSCDDITFDLYELEGSLSLFHPRIPSQKR